MRFSESTIGVEMKRTNLTIEELKNKYGTPFPVSLDGLQSYINWYNDYIFVSDWDTQRYNFCTDALDYANKAGIKQAFL